MMETSHDLGAGDRGITDQKRRPKKVVDQEVVDQIMDGLKDGQPRKTLEIAKFCGFQTKQEINPTLYYMQKSRLLAKVRFAALVDAFSLLTYDRIPMILFPTLSRCFRCWTLLPPGS